jgi:hypothetical protein
LGATRSGGRRSGSTSTSSGSFGSNLRRCPHRRRDTR